MNSGYTSIDPRDQQAVLWLQLALSKLIPGPGSMARIGEMSPITEKALMYYQKKRNLPVTRKPDEATLARIHQELKERNITL